MATALDMITRSMRLAKVIGTKEALTNDEAADGLNALNTMLEAWTLDRLSVYQIIRATKVLTASDGNYTVGAGGDIDIPRPNKLEDSCFIRVGTIDHGLELIDEISYQGIPAKSLPGRPQFLFYDPKFPLAEVNLYPVPDTAMTLSLGYWSVLQSFSTLTTDLALPLGYKRMIEYNLAVEFAPEFGVEVPSGVAINAANTLAKMKRMNNSEHGMQIEVSLNTSIRSGDISNIYG